VLVFQFLRAIEGLGLVARALVDPWEQQMPYSLTTHELEAGVENLGERMTTREYALRRGDWDDT
jgi:hypothetical protein